MEQIEDSFGYETGYYTTDLEDYDENEVMKKDSSLLPYTNASDSQELDEEHQKLNISVQIQSTDIAVPKLKLDIGENEDGELKNADTEEDIDQSNKYTNAVPIDSNQLMEEVHAKVSDKRLCRMQKRQEKLEEKEEMKNIENLSRSSPRLSRFGNRQRKNMKKNAENIELHLKKQKARRAKRVSVQVRILTDNRKVLAPIDTYLGKTNEPPLTDIFWAARKGDLRRVKYLVETEDISVNDSCLDPWNLQQTPLHWAAKGGFPEVIEYLLQAGASTKSLDQNGRLPLHLACWAGNEDAALLLLRASTTKDLYVRDYEAELCPIDWVLLRGHIKLRQAIEAVSASDHKNDSSINCKSLTTSLRPYLMRFPQFIHSKTISSSLSRALHSVRKGQVETLDCRYHFINNLGKNISPWHHIPLLAATNSNESLPNIFNYINEIPKGSSAKMEIASGEAYNPIRQDTKNGKLRYYHTPSIVNYGCFPQTWEDPSHVDTNTDCGGDDDPIDVIDIGSYIAPVGAVYPVKVLGVLGMIDDGETDWKVIAINLQDPIAHQVNTIEDLENISSLKSIVKDIHVWFRDYKLPDGKPPSMFAFDGEPMPRAFAESIIFQAHFSWKDLVAGKIPPDHKIWLPSRD